MLWFFGFVGLSAEKEATVGNVDFDEFYGSSNGFYQNGPMMVVTRVDQSGQSDSNSEDSATGSVVTNRANLCENRNERINMPFIDFLGVGAT